MENKLRVSTWEEIERFDRFNEELSKLFKSEPLSEIISTSPHVLQILAFHLVLGYLLEKWISFKINGGKSLFSGIEKTDYFTKLYIAKNAGLPKPIFLALVELNNQRNKFAHKVFLKSLDDKILDDLAKLVDAITPSNMSAKEYKISENGNLLTWEDPGTDRLRLLLVLHALLTEMVNFVFLDIHHDNSKPYILNN